MGLNDRHRFRKRVFWNASAANGILGASGVSVSGADVNASQLVLATTLGYVGIDMDATDIIAGVVPLPYDFDPCHPAYFRIKFYTNVAGTTVWIILVKMGKVNVALTAFDSLSALDTVIPSHVGTATKGYHATDWGILGTPLTQVNRNDCEAGANLQFAVEMDSASSATAHGYLGLEMGYTPMEAVGPGPLLAAPESSKLA